MKYAFARDVTVDGEERKAGQSADDLPPGTLDSCLYMRHVVDTTLPPEPSPEPAPDSGAETDSDDQDAAGAGDAPAEVKPKRKRSK